MIINKQQLTTGLKHSCLRGFARFSPAFGLVSADTDVSRNHLRFIPHTLGAIKRPHLLYSNLKV
jgi:hypothetical protein